MYNSVNRTINKKDFNENIIYRPINGFFIKIERYIERCMAYNRLKTSFRQSFNMLIIRKIKGHL